MDYTALYDMIEKQEDILRFDRFSYDDAWELGCMLRKRMAQASNPMIAEIWVNGHMVFRCAMPGSAPDNDRWLRRKKNTVEDMRMSTLRVFAKAHKEGKDIQTGMVLPLADFAVCGGAFPIVLRGVGQIGHVAVSGMPHFEDHQTIVDCLCEFLQAEAPDIRAL